MTKTLRAPRLVRRFLATGEPRCPFLSVWTLEASSTAAEDPERPMPARWPGLLRRAAAQAIHLFLTHLAYDRPAFAS